jgi:hypothetical protein
MALYRLGHRQRADTLNRGYFLLTWLRHYG